MKTLLVRLVCIALVLSVCGGSIGMAATQQICLQTGLAINTPVIEKGDFCCKKEKKTAVPQKPIFQEKCCELSVSHFKLEPESNNLFYSIKVPAILLFAVVSFIPDWLIVILPEIIIGGILNKSPPRAGRTLLTFLQILNI